MSPFETELAYRTAQRAQPDYQLDRSLIVSVLTALPRPPQGAPADWQRARDQQVIEEICTFGPRNPIEAMLAAQIVLCRHAAADSAQRALDGSLSTRQAASFGRVAQQLARTAKHLERTLKKEKKGPAGPVSGIRAPSGFDLQARDLVGLRTQPVEGEPAGCAGASSSAPLPDTLQPVAAPDLAEQTKFTLCGQRIDLVRLDTVPPAGTA